MTTKTRKRKQTNKIFPSEQMRPSLRTTTRTQVGKRVSNGVVHERQNSREDRAAQISISPNFQLQSRTNINIAQIDEPIQPNTSELISGTVGTVEGQAQDGDDNNQDNEKKCRGPTYMLEIWGRPSTLPRIQLDFDGYGRPIGPNQSKFCEFLGTIARNGMYCPLDVEDWHKMSKEYKKNMLDIVKSRYDISLGDEGWILTSINKKWRNWKSLLKARYFMSDIDVKYLVDDKDERVLQDQWINMLAYWNKEEVKVRSNRNRVARSKRTMNHLTGKKPFARVHEKLAKEKGRSPSRAEMLDACYTNSGNTPSIVSKYLEEIEELRKQLPEGSEDPIGPNDLYAQVTGPDKPGRVRMLGEGISPSDVWGEVPNKNMCKRIMLEQRSEMLKMRKELAELKSQVLIQPSSQSITTTSNNLLRLTPSNQHLQVGAHVALKSISNQGKIVANGSIQSIDPNAEVGRQVLGENWCQVHVKAVLQSEEKLVRPYGYCQTLGDALGEMVDWPCNFVMPIG